MSEAPSRIFGFEAHAARHVRGVLPGAGVTLEMRRVLSMWNVRGPAQDAQFTREAAEAFGVALPLVPNTAAGGDSLRALWLGPDEWLVAATGDALAPKQITNGTLTDVSHGRGVIRISGSRARDALAKGCSLDLDLREFPVSACAQSAFAKINIVIDHVAPGEFDLYCARSYARSFWHSLTEAAAEYAFNVVR